MSHLRTALTRIASELETGNPTRRKILAAVVTARAHENPAQKAIWNAWDHMAATEKVREFDSFSGAAGSFALGVSVAPYEVSESFYGKAANGIERKLKTLDRQSRSWRTGYNMWLEGRDIDTDRLASDMEKSLKSIKTISQALDKMGKMARDFPEAWELVDSEHKQARSAATATIAAFTNAIGILERGSW